MKTKKQITRYSIVTPFIGLADFGIYYLLIRFLPHSVSKAISYVVANAIGFLFNKYWIFKRKNASYPEAGRYLAVDLLLFGYNVAANWTILHFWPHAVFLALVIASVSTAVLSFTLKKFWVFKST